MESNKVFITLRHSSHMHVSGTNLLEEECLFWHSAPGFLEEFNYNLICIVEFGRLLLPRNSEAAPAIQGLWIHLFRSCSQCCK